MSTVYKDSFTILEVKDGNLYIEQRGEIGMMSLTELRGISGTATSEFLPSLNTQPITQVTIDTFTQPAAFVLNIPPDGDGTRMLEVLLALQISR